MTDILLSEGFALSAVGSTSPIESSAIYAMALTNIPAEQSDVSEMLTQNIVVTEIEEQVSQLYGMAIVLGRIGNRKLRAWTMSLDGHDFYVLRLGDASTLVYDTETNQWSEWASEGLGMWRAHTGMNWLGMDIAGYNGGSTSTIIAGDDTSGWLWYVVPEQGYDQSVREERDDILFTRKFTGGVPMRTRTSLQCPAIYLTAALGYPQVSGTDILLETSDDNGRSFQSHGYVSITPGQFDEELSWRSIGLIRAPGRIFRVTDTGATVRIDGLDMKTLEKEK